MTPEQRNDLCIEWDYISTTQKERIVHEYQDKYEHTGHWQDWEEYLVEQLNIKQFWRTVGLM